MTDTQPLAPTDAEIDALWVGQQLTVPQLVQRRVIARAVLSKWGTPPAVAGEQVGWMWQHDETGRTGFVDCWQVENGWQEGNPRLRLISKPYATPQPTQAQAGAVPLTPEAINVMARKYPAEDLCGWSYHMGVADAEAHHGIKGGQQ